MSDTRALRPEIKGLFETIKVQAVQYSQAFDELEKAYRQYDILTESLENKFSEISSSVYQELNQSRKEFDEIINYIKVEENKITQKYSQLLDLDKLQKSYLETLEKIKKIQIQLTEHSEEVNKYYSEYTENVKSIKENADSKVDEYLKDALSKVETVALNAQNQYEVKVNELIKQIDNKVTTNLKSYRFFYDKYNEDVKRFSGEMDYFKKNIINIELSRNTGIDPNTIKSVVNDLNDKYMVAQDEIKKLNDRIDTAYKNIKDATTTLQSGNSKHSYVSKNESAAINHLNTLIYNLEKKFSVMIGITISAIIISIVAIVLVFAF